jgi:alpha-glucosidase
MKSKTKTVLLSPCFLFACLCATANAAPSSVTSPDGKIKIHLFDNVPAGLSYQVEMDGRTIIASSRLGIRSDGKDLGSNAKLSIPDARRIDETYPLRGVKSTAINRANEAVFQVTSGGGEIYQLEVRAYDDGVASRLRLPAKPGRKVEGDLSAWQLPADSTCWFQDDLHSYEGLYMHESIGKLKTGTVIGLPSVVSLADGGFLLVTEAALVDFPDLALTVAGDQSWKGMLHAEPDGWKTDAEVLQPWRATVIARDLNALVNSDLVTNLCPPPSPELANADWIKPGRASWQWMAIGDPLLPEQPDWIQWTADLGFEYYLIDDGGSKWRDGDLDAWACLKRVCQQAA